MEIITVTKDNIEAEHICCAISNNKDIQVRSKKQWMQKNFDQGLVFKKANVRGKCFIEYIPAENAWVPIKAEGYMLINCFWISGKYKGQGHANELLEACIKDSREKGKKGLVVISSKKKVAFLSDPSYLKYKGFQIADQADPYYELLYLPFDEHVPIPKFKEQVKSPKINEKGFVLYYTHQCPFTVKYVSLIEEVATENKIPFKSILIESKEEAQNAPAPFTTYSLFQDGEFLTNEILSEKKFKKIAGV